ncbi:MAG: hypothetical protein ABIQ39_07535 [Ilumatobacteraceae bacterium]
MTDTAADPETDPDAGSQRGTRIETFGVAGTAVFLVAMAIAVPLRSQRFGQVLVAAVSMALFALGVGMALWAYTTGLERSRAENVGVANLFMVSGSTAPPAVRRKLWLCLGVQILVAVGGATVGVVGLDKDKLNALAFGVLVPMFGIGVNGLWAARYGSFGPRPVASLQPTNRKIR